jgi:transcriptional regulator with XRE-family HTH domain
MANVYTTETIKKIKIEMAKAGLNQTSLAEALGTNPQRISHAFTRSQYTLGIDSLKKIANFVGVQPEFETRLQKIDAEKYQKLADKNQRLNDKAFDLTMEIVKQRNVPMSVKKKATDLLSFLLLEEV